MRLWFLRVKTGNYSNFSSPRVWFLVFVKKMWLIWKCCRRRRYFDVRKIETSEEWFTSPYSFNLGSNVIWRRTWRRPFRTAFQSCSGVQLECRDADGAAVVQEGGSKKLRVMETYEKQKNGYQYACFCSATMLTAEILTKITEHHSEFSGCVNSCNKFVLRLFW